MSNSKKDAKNRKENYSPISLLPILSKIFEKVIFDSLYDYFIHNDLLTPCRSGFIKGDSCVNQLLAITHEIHKNLDANPSIDTVGIFLDMSKAFDKVWHNGLICKLQSYGVHSNLLLLLKNYLSNRKQLHHGIPPNLVFHKALFLALLYFSYLLTIFLIT